MTDQPLPGGPEESKFFLSPLFAFCLAGTPGHTPVLNRDRLRAKFVRGTKYDCNPPPVENFECGSFRHVVGRVYRFWVTGARSKTVVATT